MWCVCVSIKRDSSAPPPPPSGVALPPVQGHLQLQLLPGPGRPLRYRSPGLPGQIPRLRQRARLPEQVRSQWWNLVSLSWKSLGLFLTLRFSVAA